MSVLTPTKAAERIANLAGGQNNLARLLDVSQGSVWKWARHAGIPEKQVRRIYCLFNYELKIPISLYQIRPDVYAKNEHYTILGE
jgi:DNA-binding transcriptional regulator YdaS (Cro superfamily)